MTYSEHVLASNKFTYESNNDYTLQVPRWILMPIGLWPRMNAATKIQTLSSYMHILVCLSLIAIVIVPCVLYVWLEEKDGQAKLNNMGPLSHWIMGMMNYCLLFAQEDQIRKCVRHIETDWKIVRRSEDREVMLRHARIGRFVAAFCAMFMQSGTLLFALSKSLTTAIVMVGNETVTMHLMACPIYSKFIDTRFSPANEIMQVVELISIFIVNSVTAGACSLDAVFAMHAHGQLNILFLWLKSLITASDKEDAFVEQRLAIIVEHHLRVLNFISRIEIVMQHICLVELLGCAMNMCLPAYYFIMTWDTIDMAKAMSYIIIYFSMAFNIFIFCYIGEILTEQCKTVGEEVYMIHWYELPHKTAVKFVLIIARSSNIIKLTAGKLFQLSIATFSDIIKTSMIYLNILRTMTPSS